jgi:hypothetical protein
VLWSGSAWPICHLGQRTVQAVFWSIPPIFLGGAAAAAGIALHQFDRKLGGQFGPVMMGWLQDAPDGYQGGSWSWPARLLIEAVVVLAIRMPSQGESPHENRRPEGPFDRDRRIRRCGARTGSTSPTRCGRSSSS